MGSIIIRPAVQQQMDEAKRREEWNRTVFTHPNWHSEEAKAAWENRGPTPAGILLPLKNADWFALGYDAAKINASGLQQDAQALRNALADEHPDGVERAAQAICANILGSA